MSWPLSPWVAFRWFQSEAEPTDKPPSETNLEAAMASSIFSEPPSVVGHTFAQSGAATRLVLQVSG
jgi:hypothetical protein